MLGSPDRDDSALQVPQNSTKRGRSPSAVFVEQWTMMSRPPDSGGCGLLLSLDNVVRDCRTTGPKSSADSFDGGRWPLAVSKAMVTSRRMTADGVATGVDEGGWFSWRARGGSPPP
ncbi:hypothetical protein V5S80_00980 [Corynebacterium kroppenstedtii]|uniref:hypothetical protein n=1 Tax=Corynebacterium sp. PCR 32 TaxID=3351342 RepID=UPI0030AA91C1